MIKALICDDDQNCIEQISMYFEKYCFENNIICSYDASTDGKDVLLSNENYTIAFLDIEIGSITGLQIAEHLKSVNQDIIIFFITAYNKYIDDAMDLFALRFLEKPVDYSRFYTGLNKAIELINDQIVEFFLKDTNTLKRIKSDTILYIETCDHKTKIVTKDNTYYSRKTIDEWENDLTNICFSRVHKSFLLNMRHVDSYTRVEVKMPNGDIVPIAYRNQTYFRKEFASYLNRRKS